MDIKNIQIFFDDYQFKNNWVSQSNNADHIDFIISLHAWNYMLLDDHFFVHKFV